MRLSSPQVLPLSYGKGKVFKCILIFQVVHHATWDGCKLGFIPSKEGKTFKNFHSSHPKVFNQRVSQNHARAVSHLPPILAYAKWLMKLIYREKLINKHTEICVFHKHRIWRRTWLPLFPPASTAPALCWAKYWQNWWQNKAVTVNVPVIKTIFVEDTFLPTFSVAVNGWISQVFRGCVVSKQD